MDGENTGGEDLPSVRLRLLSDFAVYSFFRFLRTSSLPSIRFRRQQQFLMDET